MWTRGRFEAGARLVIMGGLAIGLAVSCTGGEGDDGDGAAGSPGEAGAAAEGGAGVGNGSAGDSGSGNGGGSAGESGSGAGGSFARESGPGAGGASAGEGGIGAGGGSAGEGGFGPGECPPGGFEIVGKAGCFECPGYIYEPYASTCATLAGDASLHHYDAAAHQLRLRAGDGFPVPQPGFGFHEIYPSFDTDAHRLACSANPGYAVDGAEYVVDLSAYGACAGLTDLVLFDLLPNYGCAHSLPNSTYVSLHFEGGTSSVHLECHSPNDDAPIVFGSLVPYPRPARFDASTPGAVADNETGLVWQQLANGAYPSLNQADAIAHCSALTHAGKSDWRLPTAGELFSLIDIEAGGASHYDPVAFPNSPADTYWSASPHASDPFLGWTVFFGYYGEFLPGVVGLPVVEDYSDLEHHVRCVRAGLPPSPRYTDSGAGTVLDNLTGLVWEKAPTLGDLTPREAQQYCRDLSLAGGGWRVPTLGDLIRIADYTKFPARDGVFESVPNVDAEWSASPYVETATGYWGGWYLNEDGTPYPAASGDPIDSGANIRCVR